MMEYDKKTALITGASGGLGMEFARIFAAKGYQLVLVARSEDRLQALRRELEAAHGIQARVLTCDLTREDAVPWIMSQLDEGQIDVDVLVNNAGFGDFGPFSQSSLKKQEDMIRLNVSALVALTHGCLPGMLARGEGKILNVASIAAFQPGPLMSVYYATKAFVLSFTEALSVENRGTGVTFSALCPGPITTGFEKGAELEKSGLFKNLKNDDPKDVAAFGYRMLMKGRVVAVDGWQYRLMLFAARSAPRSVVRQMAYRIQKEKD